METKTKIAVLEVEFNPDIMWDEESINDQFKGDWLEAMRYLYEQDGMGIFDEPILVGVKLKEANDHTD